MRIELAQRNGDVVLAIADDGAGIEDAAARDGALDRRAPSSATSSAGRWRSRTSGGLRAEVVFPA